MHILQCISNWFYFTPIEMLAVNRVPIKALASCGTIQCLERVPPSSFRGGGRLWQLHACTLAEVKAVTSEGTVKSQPALCDGGVCSPQSARCFQSAGLLLCRSHTVSAQRLDRGVNMGAKYLRFRETRYKFDTFID